MSTTDSKFIKKILLNQNILTSENIFQLSAHFIMFKPYTG